MTTSVNGAVPWPTDTAGACHVDLELAQIVRCHLDRRICAPVEPGDGKLRASEIAHGQLHLSAFVQLVEDLHREAVANAAVRKDHVRRYAIGDDVDLQDGAVEPGRRA